MKKVVSILLMFTLIITTCLLSACGNSKTTGENEQASGDAGVAYDALNITFASAYSETETGGQIVAYFTDYITEKSGGDITFDVLWGGTLCDASEQLDFVGTNACDMSMISQANFTDVLPLLNFPGWANGSQETTVDYFNYMIWENKETSELIQQQIADQNVYFLNCHAGGSNAFVSSKEYATLEEMKGLKIGTGMNLSAFEALGFSIVNMMPWDGYDSLQRGIVDLTTMAVVPMVSMSWHEVAPYFLRDTTYSAGNFLAINLDVWDSLSDNTKALFNEAAEASTQNSLDLYEKAEAEADETVVASGGKMSALSDEDATAFVEALFNSSAEDCRSYGESAGCSEEMELILKAASEYLGIDF